MGRRVLLATTLILLFHSSGQAADLIWEVESPFRFFKTTSAFEMHERAFQAARGPASAPLPPNIVWRTERKLNDPDCRDASSPAACANTARARYEASRLGWAAQTLDVTCYERTARPRRYPAQCERRYSWGVAREDYVLPDAHTVIVRLAPEHAAAAGSGECQWTWQPRRPGLPAESRAQPCAERLVIKRVPYSVNRGVSGVAVRVALPDGRTLADPDVVVEDLLIVALGDSFASGESNPDRPVTFSAAREMVYEPFNARPDEIATRSLRQPMYGIMSAPGPDRPNPKALPKRLMEDEENGLIYRPTSPEFLSAFEKRAAQWLSPDCHRSQYGYPFRVGLQLALENRHRAVTLVSLACTGADTLEGLFEPREAREQYSGPSAQKSVPAQFDQLADLLCRPGAPRSRAATYLLPVYRHGSTAVQNQPVGKAWCPPESRRRAIDLVLLSIGGNDVGFGALAAYGITERASDLAPIVGLVGRELRYPPSVARVYLDLLDRRLKAVRDALFDGFGVEPSDVLYTAYEPVQFDESGRVCGSQPTLGLDVHPDLRYGADRMRQVSDFARDLHTRLECISDGRNRPGCPHPLATGQGTGFRFVADHVTEFARRGACARDPQRAQRDELMMAMPRMSLQAGEFRPTSPAEALPYARRWRLIHTPNDAFLTANTHRGGISPFDILQPAYAALYSGAFHPTAEGHAIVADAVVRHARETLARRAVAQGR